ncbi:MAG: hypothetical protein J6Y91_02560 [Alphaproteobacteria bacterium]|nr:hypothetical protein [Alphaproteobacteria bacterium]
MKKFISLLICGLLVSWNAAAKMEYVATIPVDVEAENSVIAKDKAMIDAQRQAFLEVSGKLVSEDHKQKLEQLSDDAIVHFIKSVSVADEKAGGTKYIANLTIQINEQLLRDYLAENEMIQSETTEILVIPVLKAEGDSHPLLWEEDNGWLKFWHSKGLIKFGTMQIRTVYENLRTIEDFSAVNAVYMDEDLYREIVDMTKTERIYVVYAEILQNGDIKVTVKDERNKLEDNFTVYNEGGASNMFEKAVEKSVMFISNMERNAKNQESVTSVSSINVVYMYQNMKDWLQKSRMIEDLSQVEGIDTKSFGGGKVNFALRYTGSLDDLWNALQDLGLSHDAADNYFIIR